MTSEGTADCSSDLSTLVGEVKRLHIEKDDLVSQVSRMQVGIAQSMTDLRMRSYRVCEKLQTWRRWAWSLDQWTHPLLPCSLCTGYRYAFGRLGFMSFYLFECSQYCFTVGYSMLTLCQLLT